MMTQVCANQLKEVYEEELGWDSNGEPSLPMTQFTLFRAHNIVNYLISKVGVDKWIDPEISRGFDGDIDFEWESPTHYFSIHLLPYKDKPYIVRSKAISPPFGEYASLERILDGLLWFLGGGSTDAKVTEETNTSI